MTLEPEFEIKIIETESLISVIQGMPPLLTESALTTIGTPKEDQLQILVGPDAFSTTNKHSQSDLTREVGGFLIGRPYEWKGRRYIEIMGALPGEMTTGSASQLTITSETWARATKMVSQKFGDMHIVGWYHTHPHMAVFLSPQDVAIQQGFFSEPWQVALVIEPSKPEAGFFVWDEDRLESASGYGVLYPNTTPKTAGWQLPIGPIPRVFTAKKPLLLTGDEFDENTCWYTEWKETDGVTVKIEGKVMARIAKYASTAPRIVLGICFGNVYVNQEQEGPKYFVEIIDVNTPDGPAFTASLTSASSDWEELLEALQKISYLQVVGWFWLDATPDSAYKIMQMHKQNFPNRWQITLVGDLYARSLFCVFPDNFGKLILRKLVERNKPDELWNQREQKVWLFPMEPKSSP